MFNSAAWYISKPAPPAKFDPPEYHTVCKNLSDSNSWALKNIDFLMEMMKFFSDYEQTSYFSGQVAAETEEGLGDHLREYLNTVGGQVYWGTQDDMKKVGESMENVDFHPTAFDFFHFIDREASGPLEDPININDYKDLNICDPSLADGEGSIETYEDLWSQIMSFNGQYEDKDFYEIVMDEDYRGKEGSNGEGAFALMVAMLESRRRINTALTDVYGPWQNIYNNDVQASKDWLSNALSSIEKGGSANFIDKRAILSFIQPLNSFHSVAYALGTGNYDDIQSELGQEKVKSWYQWFSENIENYINSTTISDSPIDYIKREIDDSIEAAQHEIDQINNKLQDEKLPESDRQQLTDRLEQLNDYISDLNVLRNDIELNLTKYKKDLPKIKEKIENLKNSYSDNWIINNIDDLASDVDYSRSMLDGNYAFQRAMNLWNEFTYNTPQPFALKDENSNYPGWDEFDRSDSNSWGSFAVRKLNDYANKEMSTICDVLSQNIFGTMKYYSDLRKYNQEKTKAESDELDRELDMKKAEQKSRAEKKNLESQIEKTAKKIKAEEAAIFKKMIAKTASNKKASKSQPVNKK